METTVVVEDAEITVAAVPPKVTALVPDRLVPVSVTDVPPAVVPLVGVSEDKVGGSWKVNEVLSDRVPEPLVTATVTAPAEAAWVTDVSW